MELNGDNAAHFVFGAHENIDVPSLFKYLRLQEKLLRNLHTNGIRRPTTVQQRAILPMIVGRDVVIQARSGTGKTVAFFIAMLQSINIGQKDTQVLCLSPTRELAIELQETVLKLGSQLNIVCQVCIGGTKVSDNLRKLQSGQHIISGTPGRVFDLIKRNALRVDKIQTLLIDKADGILNKGFQKQLYNIYGYLSPTTQVVLLSETLPNKTLTMIQHFTTRPVKIFIENDQFTLNGIKQFYVVVNFDKRKIDIICDLYDSLIKNQAVIFCSTKKKVIWLTIKMKKLNFPVSAIHEDMSEREKDIVIREFRSGATKMLISTDLLTRDMVNVQHMYLVINYDFPHTRELYIHRVGVSSSIGHCIGIAISFVKNDHMSILRNIERYYSTRIYKI